MLSLVCVPHPALRAVVCLLVPLLFACDLGGAILERAELVQRSSPSGRVDRSLGRFRLQTRIVFVLRSPWTGMEPSLVMCCGSSWRDLPVAGTRRSKPRRSRFCRRVTLRSSTTRSARLPRSCELELTMASVLSWNIGAPRRSTWSQLGLALTSRRTSKAGGSCRTHAARRGSSFSEALWWRWRLCA